MCKSCNSSSNYSSMNTQSKFGKQTNYLAAVVATDWDLISVIGDP